ncbi:kinase-like domain-containing protein [Cerioporus squamosus]|nr:kinase-like domain-containing protein [Cerioporus squamosus]
MALATFWDGHGQLQVLDEFPYSEEHWSLGEEIDDTRRALLDRIEVALSSKIVSTEVRAPGPRNLVLEVELEDGRREIVRVPLQGVERFESEVALLAWLSRRSPIPVPRLRCVVRRSTTELHTFAVMEKLPGNCLTNVFGRLSYDDKVSIVRDTAKIMVQLSELAVPAQIGVTLIQGDDVSVIAPPGGSGRVFDTLDEYMYARIEARRASPQIGSDDADRTRADAALTRLAEALPHILARLSSPLYRRCVLRHNDLNGTNILVDENHVSGIIDWEFHTTIPIVLAAKPPFFVRYDGVNDPQFNTDKVLSMLWVATGEDASKLHTVYTETVKELNEEYWRVLIDGKLLQQIEEWLSDDELDPGCDRMSAWMDTVFSEHTRSL